jgi:hypothetical protein
MRNKRVRALLAAAPPPAPAEKPQFAIKIAWPTAVIECFCGAGATMVIVGDTAPVTCPACGVKRQIATNWAMQVIPA